MNILFARDEVTLCGMLRWMEFALIEYKTIYSASSRLRERGEAFNPADRCLDSILFHDLRKDFVSLLLIDLSLPICLASLSYIDRHDVSHHC